MANWTRRRFSQEQDMLDWLNGAMIGSVNLHTEGADVDGLTLIIHDGGGNQTVTFAPAKGRNWTAQEIVDEINAVGALTGVATLKTFKQASSLAVPVQRLRIMGDPAHIIRGDGTSNAALGFAGPATPANDTTQVIIPDTEVTIQPLTIPNKMWSVIRYA